MSGNKISWEKNFKYLNFNLQRIIKSPKSDSMKRQMILLNILFSRLTSHITSQLSNKNSHPAIQNGNLLFHVPRPRKLFLL